ncbi:lipopolysaccharide assembly protein LapA domain-containing protein [Marinifilum fragile]|uniref:lipopolysaccharide assembly protein LapA domain-containing protein n=1 Tax=Marinifilum fragile TaxID=570161 RepID=UPI0006D0371B|nr:LapA family protein [Marinifilum fragile]
MKIIKILALLLLLITVLIFAFQNLVEVDVNFISWSITTPFSLTIILTFVVGVITGSLLLLLVERKKKKDDVE